MERNNLINDSQHGFRQGRSCATNLIEFFNVVTSALDDGESIDVIFLDFAKAFDKVPIKKLLVKLKQHGIGGRLWTWIESWLTGRKQRVVLNGRVSAWTEVLSGVPQGSVLGPVLFLIFINDLDGATQLVDILRKFADDTKLGKVIRTNEDARDLQQALTALEDWAATWGMAFNTGKCKVMHLGANNGRSQYTMGGQVLQQIDEERDIGVTVTNNMKPAAMCCKAARTASTVLGQITRAFSYRDKHTFVRLYKQYVRPHLEFASQAWRPWLRKDIDMLEKVQMRAVRMVGGLRGTTYEEKLAELNLQSLEERRLEADLVLAFKIMHGVCKVKKDDWFQPVAAISQQRTRAAADLLRLAKPRSRLDLRSHFYTVRIIDTWNSLPYETRAAASVQVFRTALRRSRGAPADGNGGQGGEHPGPA